MIVKYKARILIQILHDDICSVFLINLWMCPFAVIIITDWLSGRVNVCVKSDVMTTSHIAEIRIWFINIKMIDRLNFIG